jgi:phosphoribosylcarboxyaminoimidazole (NCAIR) mutase
MLLFDIDCTNIGIFVGPGILAAQIIANEDNAIREKVAAFRAKQTQDVLDNPNPAI